MENPITVDNLLTQPMMSNAAIKKRQAEKQQASATKQAVSSESPIVTPARASSNAFAAWAVKKRVLGSAEDTMAKYQKWYKTLENSEKMVLFIASHKHSLNVEEDAKLAKKYEDDQKYGESAPTKTFRAVHEQLKAILSKENQVIPSTWRDISVLMKTDAAAIFSMVIVTNLKPLDKKILYSDMAFISVSLDESLKQNLLRLRILERALEICDAQKAPSDLDDDKEWTDWVNDISVSPIEVDVIPFKRSVSEHSDEEVITAAFCPRPHELKRHGEFKAATGAKRSESAMKIAIQIANVINMSWSYGGSGDPWEGSKTISFNNDSEFMQRYYTERKRLNRICNLMKKWGPKQERMTYAERRKMAEEEEFTINFPKVSV